MLLLAWCSCKHIARCEISWTLVVQLSGVDPLKIRELKAAAGKYAYSSRIKWLHVDDNTQVGHFESIREELRYYNRQLDWKVLQIRLCDRVKSIL